MYMAADAITKWKRALRIEFAASFLAASASSTDSTCYQVTTTQSNQKGGREGGT